MPRREYQESLEELRADVQQLGDLVLHRLERSLSALESHDAAVAQAIIEGDHEINQRYLELESSCIDLFALQQPVASDLRFIAASFKILTDLERIGDLATNFAQYTLETGEDSPRHEAIYDIGHEAHALVTDAIEAYGTADAHACRQIAKRDEDIDVLCHRASERVVRDLIERKSTNDDPWSVEQVMDEASVALLTIRDLERVGDHGVNIAARTLYLVENDPSLIY